jgi:diphthine synthase
MTLYIIGIGLSDEKDITVKGLEIVRKSSQVYLESYTAILNCSKEDLERFYGCEVILADREFVEKTPDKMLDKAASADVAFLVVGDPMSATTHTDMVLRAFKKGVGVQIVHNASILTAVGTVGLELYKYGRTTSIVFPEKDWKVETHYDAIKTNIGNGLHTLCLLDIKTSEPGKEDIQKGKTDRVLEPRFMTVNQAIQNLLDIEKSRGEGVFTEDTLVVGCARIGSSTQIIKAGTAKELLNTDFGGPLHSLIVPGKLHFMEEEALERWQ